MKIRIILGIFFVSALVPLSAFADEATTTPDTIASVITAPADQTFSTTTFPALPVLVYATATDDTDPAPVVTYSPTSFAHGTTTLTWTATDASGNAATTSSQVGVFLNIETSADVPATCNTTDTDAVVHAYPEATSSTAYLAICALQAALDSGAVSDAQLSNQFPSLGLFVTAVNGIAADPNGQYWALYQNGSFANFGLTQLPVAAGDIIALQLHDFSDNNLGDVLTLHIQTLVAAATTTGTSTPIVTEESAPSNSGGGGGGETVHFNLNVPSALAYLVSQQNADGSFGSSLLTDWAAIAFASSGAGEAKTKLRDYLLAAPPTLSNVTDYERHAMALMSLGINPYTGTSKDYITPIVNAFDGTQIGDVHLDNDDIFAIFPLMSAGYSPSDPMMKSIVAYILKAQRPDGSWDGSPDMTAAAVQAIGPFFTVPGYGAAMGRAMGYLASTQQASGGWGGIDSTSWVQTMVNAAKELDPAHAPTFTSSGGRFPMDEIAGTQQADGAVRPVSDTVDNRVWSTSYAVVAASGKSWLTLLQPFPRPSGSGITTSGGGLLETSATSTGTTTPLTASTTPPIATSTPETISTSTPTVTDIIQSTTTPSTSSGQAATTTPKKIQPKTLKVVEPKKTPAPPVATASSAPPVTSNQTAAAATANPSKVGFLSNLWRSIASFFRQLF